MLWLGRVVRAREGLTVRFDCLSGAVLPVKIRPPTKFLTTSLIKTRGSCMLARRPILDRAAAPCRERSPPKLVRMI